MADEKMVKPTQSIIVSLMAETHIHTGIGQSTGALDLPVARERASQYPFVPGSGVKGAFRVWACERARLSEGEIRQLFGREGQAENDQGDSGSAGRLLCSDARLLLLPVRSLSGAYKWLTCPGILDRYQRDTARSQNGATEASNSIQSPARGHYLGEEGSHKWLGLEEREFGFQKSCHSSIVTALIAVLPEPVTKEDLERRLVILHDDDFTWFAKYALPVMAHNALEEKTKRSKALWYEESLPPDTIMYVLFGERTADAVKTFRQKLEGAPYVQIGGNETVGMGWFIMKPVARSAGRS